MPVPIRDIQFDQTDPTVFNNDYGDSLPNNNGGGSNIGLGGGNGGTTRGGGSTSQTSNTSPSTTSNVLIFSVNSNQTKFNTTINGENVSNSKSIRVNRQDLALENKKIEVNKQGYKSNEYYIIEMVDDNSPIIINPNIEQPLGLSTKDIVLYKYINGRLNGTPTSIKNEIVINLDFTFSKIVKGDEYEEPNKFKSEFNISGTGSSVSILKNGNKSAEFFPPIGNSVYEDVDGTVYKIRSSDLSLYRIKFIYWQTGGNGKDAIKQYTAESGESLEIDVTLKGNYTFQIETEEVFQGSAGLNPQIQLLKTDTRTYNINSKLGVPLAFRKNADVKTITVVIGDEVLEFDKLDKGTICGITIPHSAFKNIGKYNIQIFPFSLDDYENEVSPPQPKDTIEPKKVEAKYDVKEEVKVDPPTIKDKVNPYKPTTQIVRGSGGGGGGRPAVIFDGNDIQSDINPFTNQGDFVNRVVDNRNIR